MRPKALTVSVAIVLMVLPASAHDLFLKLDSYFLPPNTKAKVQLLNGTFQSSDGLVRRDRMGDISLIARDAGLSPAKSISWRDLGKTTLMEIQTGGTVTYVVGISTKPREIDLKAADFNDYLKHDGIPDILAKRTTDGELGKDIRERYSKHVRAIFQVGSARTEEYRTSLQYPVEIIPQTNPYSLKVGQTLPVLCTLDGQPPCQPIRHRRLGVSEWEIKFTQDQNRSKRHRALQVDGSRKLVRKNDPHVPEQ